MDEIAELRRLLNEARHRVQELEEENARLKLENTNLHTSVKLDIHTLAQDLKHQKADV